MLQQDIVDRQAVAAQGAKMAKASARVFSRAAMGRAQGPLDRSQSGASVGVGTKMIQGHGWGEIEGLRPPTGFFCIETGCARFA